MKGEVGETIGVTENRGPWEGSSDGSTTRVRWSVRSTLPVAVYQREEYSVLFREPGTPSPP